MAGMVGVGLLLRNVGTELEVCHISADDVHCVHRIRSAVTIYALEVYFFTFMHPKHDA